ncbi:MAG: CRISPR-associated endoribonuclease Cas6 [Prolixibacteraceae bacterium]
MRAYLKISAKNCIIPFDHRDELLQIIHQWLGWNSKTEPLPAYCFSRFEGGRNSLQGITFNDDTNFFFSSPDAELVKKLGAGAKANPRLFNGLKVIEIKLSEAPDLSKRELFYAASPLLLEEIKGNQTDYIVYSDEYAEQFLKEHCQLKLSLAGIADETFDVRFDPNYASAGTKKITYNDRIMRASWCQILLKGLPETKQYLWHIGLGDATHLGFGAIM